MGKKYNVVLKYLKGSQSSTKKISVSKFFYFFLFFRNLKMTEFSDVCYIEMLQKLTLRLQRLHGRKIYHVEF